MKLIRILSASRPERFFLCLSLTFGLLFLFITPPFQSPDEVNHFYRAYQISEGQFLAVKQNGRLGGQIPVSLVEVVKPFKHLIRNVNDKTDWRTIKDGFNIPLNPINTEFVDFPNTSMFAAVSYMPQALVIGLLKMADVAPLYMFYAGRLCSLLCWCLGLFIAIRIMPFYKWLFSLLLLLPMAVFVSMSLSADIVTDVLSILLIAYIFNLIYVSKMFGRKQFVVLLVLTILLASSKLIYTPLIGLVVLIPKRKFSSIQWYYINTGSLLLIAFITMLVWSNILNKQYIPYSDYNSAYRNDITLMPDANMYAQTEYILHHGMHIVKVFIYSVLNVGMYATGYIGTFGWLDTRLPKWLVGLSYVIIVFVVLIDKEEKIKLNLNHKLFFILIGGVTASLLLFSQYLTWDSVGAPFAASIQGRYLIPILPLIFILGYNSLFVNNRLLVPLVVMFSLCSLSISANTIYKRFYIPTVFQRTSILCDAEQLTEDRKFVTNDPTIFLSNGNTQRKKYAYSGNYSSEVYKIQPFGMLYSVRNCQYGDVFEIDVWRYGKNGDIVISSELNGIYDTKSMVVEKNKNGWERLHLIFTMPNNMGNKEVSVYVFNDAQNGSYFDDMNIRYSRVVE